MAIINKLPLLTLDGTMPTVNVKDYGATGDGETDDISGIQDAVDDLSSSRGGRVFFPLGTYRISQALEVTGMGVELVGEGNPGFYGTEGSTRIVPDAGESGILFNIGGWHFGFGIALRRLCIIAADGSTGGDGVVIDNASASIIEDCQINGFEAGCALKLDGGPSSTVKTVIRHMNTRYCLKGIWQTGAAVNSTCIYSCGFSNAQVHTEIPEGSIAIHVEPDGEQHHQLWVYDSMFEGWDTGIYWNSSGVGCNIQNVYFEYNNNAIHLGSVARFVQMTNFVVMSMDGGSTSILIDEGAHDNIFMPARIYPNEDVTDNGVRTVWYGFAPVPGT